MKLAMRTKLPDLASLLEPRAVTLEELKELVSALDAPSTRRDACAVLHELAAGLESRKSDRGLRLFSMDVPGCADPIRLILHPAIFEPEQWGRTFAEGLLKDPDIFAGKNIVELGTGSGWISLLLLQRTGARKILGLDLNPLAVAIARINTWLNGSDAQGNVKLTPAGQPLVEAFRVEVSDLLEQPLSRGEHFDHIIGCIPQVLHPDPESLKSKRRMSHRDLYDLSNYCFEQGILEDRFGLPLIARALEQAQLCINPSGLLTLILGGRPGLEAIDGMFRRRGYEPELWWSRRIQQADDTDIASLVALEKTHGIKFHFYSSYSSKQSVPASTAMRLLENNKPIYHDLLVMQARTRFEKPTIAFVKNLHELGMSDLRKEIDLSKVSDEQISFVARLTEELLKGCRLPYPHERGDMSLREKIARFLHTYCGFVTSAEHVFVGPERPQLVSGILSMLASPGEKILLSGSLDSVYGRMLNSRGYAKILGNDELSELLELDSLFKPTLSILAPYEMGDPSPLVLQAFIRQARENPERWYLIDDSANFEIGSALKANVMMRMLGQEKLPPNLVFLYGLIKSTVAPDLQLSFTINAPDAWINGLDVAAELSYSRIAYPTQLYYEWLFDELLAFPFPEPRPETVEPRALPKGHLSPWFLEISKDPSLAPKPIDPEQAGVIRFDYGEFEGPIPKAVVRGLVKGFLERHQELHDIVTSRFCSYVETTRGVSPKEGRVVIGQGVFPLLGAVISALRQRLGRDPVVGLPNGSYGLVYPLIAYYGGEVVDVPTDADNGFLVNLQALARLTKKPDILWLTQPNNPSGLFLDADTVRGVMQLCAEQGIYVLSDEIFFLLSEPRAGVFTDPQLSFAQFLTGNEARWLFVTDGLSKSFAAGGLRCGFVVCPDERWADEVQSYCFYPPSAMLRACDSVYSVFLKQAPHQMMDLEREFAEIQGYLTGARQMLDDHRQQLLELLREFDLADHSAAKRGALFILGKLDEQASARLAREEMLLVNPPPWGRTPGWSRLCFSVEPARFRSGLERLRKFLTKSSR